MIPRRQKQLQSGWSQPNVTKIISFLDLAGYYQMFVKIFQR